MTYQEYIQQLAVYLPQILTAPFDPINPFSDPNYNTMVPRAIEYAEGLIYRDPDMDFLSEPAVDSSLTFTAGSRNFTIPASMVIVEQLAAIVPTATAPAAGTRVPFLRTTTDFINFVWPQESATATPSIACGSQQCYFAMLTSTTAIVAPTPDANYTVEVTGNIRPTPLAQSAGATSYLTLTYPTLFTAASMIFWAGVQRNWGQQADDPQMALSWKQQYDFLKQGIVSETGRQQGQGPGWTPYGTTPVATPPRN